MLRQTKLQWLALTFFWLKNLYRSYWNIKSNGKHINRQWCVDAYLKLVSVLNWPTFWYEFIAKYFKALRLFTSIKSCRIRTWIGKNLRRLVIHVINSPLRTRHSQENKCFLILDIFFFSPTHFCTSFSMLMFDRQTRSIRQPWLCSYYMCNECEIRFYDSCDKISLLISRSIL